MAANGVRTLYLETSNFNRSFPFVDKQGVVRYKKILAPKEPLVENEELLAEVKKIK